MGRLTVIYDDADPPIVAKIRWYPRADASGFLRVVGGQFQGSNTSETTGYTTLATITMPAMAQWYEIILSNPISYRWFRYFGPDGGFCDMAEIEVYNKSGERIMGTPFGLDPSYGDQPSLRYPSAWDGDINTFYDYYQPYGGYTGIKITGLGNND